MPSSKTTESTDLTDWAALRALSEDEIERMAAQDEDNPATEASHWKHAAVGPVNAKTSVHATFDHDVVAFFKRDGRGYSARMNAVLRRYMEAQQRKV